MTTPIDSHTLARLLLAQPSMRVQVFPVNDDNPDVGLVRTDVGCPDFARVYLPKWQVDKPEDETFRLYWMNGKTETIQGATIEAAFNSRYGGGAMAALDFFAPGHAQDYTWNKEKRTWDKKPTGPKKKD